MFGQEADLSQVARHQGPACLTLSQGAGPMGVKGGRLVEQPPDVFLSVHQVPLEKGHNVGVATDFVGEFEHIMAFILKDDEFHLFALRA